MFKMNKGTVSQFPQRNLAAFSEYEPRRNKAPSEGIFWMPVVITLLVVLITPVLAILLVTLSLLPGIDRSAAIQVGNYQVPFGIAMTAVVGAFLLLGLLVARLTRRRLLRDQALCAENGCPVCGQQELIRTRRLNSDRTLNRTGMPVFRYACRNCHWQGRRLGLFQTPTYFSTSIVPQPPKDRRSAPARMAARTRSPLPDSEHQAAEPHSAARPDSHQSGMNGQTPPSAVPAAEDVTPQASVPPAHVPTSTPTNSQTIIEPLLITAQQNELLYYSPVDARYTDFDPEEFERLCLAAVERKK
jgi:hypothetical protein